MCLLNIDTKQFIGGTSQSIDDSDQDLKAWYAVSGFYVTDMSNAYTN